MYKGEVLSAETNEEIIRAAVVLYYNFCCVHKTLRCAPAMEAGITGHIWELRELLG